MLEVDFLPNDLLGLPRQRVNIKCCHSFQCRLKGFIGRRSIAENELLWLKPCAVVHTFGMRCSLALIFIDRYGRCLHIVERAPPNRIFYSWQARSVIEMRSRSYAEVRWLWQSIAPALKRRLR